MIDPTIAINQIKLWDVKHPRPVQRLLDCCEALEKSQPQAPGWGGLNDPKTVLATVEENARFNSISGEATREALSNARYQLANSLLSAVSSNLDSYAEQFENRFDDVARKYEEAVGKLPTDFTANDVTTFEPAEFEAFAQARSAASELSSILAWLVQVSETVPGQGFNSEQWAKEFLIAEPNSVATYATIQLANCRNADNALMSVNPVLMKAVRAGASLQFRLPSVAKESVDSWENERQSMDDERWGRLRSHIAG